MRSFTIPSILALASVTSAMPKPEQWEGPNPWDGVIDPWGEYGVKPGESTAKRSPVTSTKAGKVTIAGQTFSTRQIREAMKRDSIAQWPGKLPNCNSENDPSNAGTPIPGWPVNHGYKIPKNGDHDECTTGHGGDHCWTEYYLVEGAVEYFDWQVAGSAVHCSAEAKASCSVTLGDIQQTCTTTGQSISNGYDWKVIDAAGSGSFKFGGDKLGGEVSLSVGGGYSKSHVETNTQMTQVCKADTTSVTCSWTNDSDAPKEMCHQAWFADRVMHVWGQSQRVCNKCTKGNVQQNTGDGRVCVRGQREFDFRMPINKLVNCNGKCDEALSGLPKPPNGNRGPFSPPNN
ncbi:hypothetical protein V8F33_009629 [Rhypophila sp. PSN 637]